MPCCDSSDADVKVWSLGTGQESTTLRGHKAGLCALQFDDQRLVTASEDRTVRLWDYHTERELHTFYGHKAWVRCIHLTHDSLWSGYEEYPNDFCPHLRQAFFCCLAVFFLQRPD